ncbi:MAG: hypothetical protein LBS59_08265 [Puniceicoccales bacterium]|jgi:hypothetical protein|nr:hypothetical protein [Puniceicoccales bacterium]
MKKLIPTLAALGALTSGFLLFSPDAIATGKQRTLTNEPKPIEKSKKPAPSKSWRTNYHAAYATAKSSSKSLFAYFTGPEDESKGWEEGRFEDLFRSSEFNDYAAKNFVTVKVEFPKSDLNSAEQKQYRELLKKQHIPFYPYFIVVDPDGGKRWASGNSATIGSGPKHFVTKLTMKKEKWDEEKKLSKRKTKGISRRR